MIKCKYADKYQAKRKPTCNKGKGCYTCRTKWCDAARKELEHEFEVIKTNSDWTYDGYSPYKYSRDAVAKKYDLTDDEQKRYLGGL